LEDERALHLETRRLRPGGERRRAAVDLAQRGAVVARERQRQRQAHAEPLCCLVLEMVLVGDGHRAAAGVTALRRMSRSSRDARPSARSAVETTASPH